MRKSRLGFPRGRKGDVSMPHRPSGGVPTAAPIELDIEVLRDAIREEYETVARDPGAASTSTPAGR
jgi:hypothetical protein